MRTSTIRNKIKTRITVTDKGCWEWQGASSSNKWGRYGIIWLQGKGWRVHRIAYKAWVGSIPDGYVIHHKCLNTLCCNPDHLEAVTNAKNVQYSTGSHDVDGVYICKRGHRVEGSNVGRNSDGRYCLACKKFLMNSTNVLQF